MDIIIGGLIILAVIATGIAVYVRSLRGENLSRYDVPHKVTHPEPASQGMETVNAFLEKNFTAPAKAGGEAATLRAKRQRFEAMSDGREFDCVHIQASANGVEGEWTVVDGADLSQRILYIHGGAFAVGSAKSHRAITYNIAKRTGCAVFAPNYRLIPEHSRFDGIADCKTAYRWILGNGPDGESAAKSLGVMGDSAGGSLSLVIARWATRNGHVRNPNAIIGLSPTVDTTAQSPSIKANLDTDVMLKPLIGPLVKIPNWVYLLACRKTLGGSPSDPRLSPIMGDLSGLPPTLLQVSASEMLFDDSLRFAEKMRREGGDARVQSWAEMCHVWQIFDQMIPEAGAAYDAMATFLAQHGVGTARHA